MNLDQTTLTHIAIGAVAVFFLLRHLGWRREFIDIDGSGRRVWRFFPN